MSNTTGSFDKKYPDILPAGAILAGGASSRMGEPKAVTRLGDKSLLDRVAGIIAPQVSALVIVGGTADWARPLGLEYRADSVAGGRGPLVGLLSAMDHLAEVGSKSEFVFVTATDMPFLPVDLVSRLMEKSGDGLPVIPRSGGRLQPLAALWPLSLYGELVSGLKDKSLDSMKDLYQRTGFLEASYENEPQDPFFNVNTPEDLDRAERLIGGLE